jgi:putative ABC transport system permease protein
MNNSIQIIPLFNLALAFIPVIVVILILWNWKLKYFNSLYAVFRMLIQLLLIGYFLAYIFEADNSNVVLGVLLVMLLSSSIIALRTIEIPKKNLYAKSFLAISISGCLVLILITQGVLRLQPWYLPSYMIPLAGMIFANAMNSVSIAGERFGSEIRRGTDYPEARNLALKASLIPITNSLFAVGLVSLPGMMTGQILSGVSPFIAARYQIMVMCMVYGSAGISSAIFLMAVKSDFTKSLSAD